MNSPTTIEIDLALHKAIEAERRSFSETANEILHRLILNPPEQSTNGLANKVPSTNAKAWSGGGVELPHGTKLRMSYNGCQHTAEIIDGRWFVDGDFYNAPSAASHAVARTKAGDPAHINGWDYWWALLPGQEKWRLMSTMRNLGTDY